MSIKGVREGSGVGVLCFVQFLDEFDDKIDIKHDIEKYIYTYHHQYT